jgi:hypothetical protein
MPLPLSGQRFSLSLKPMLPLARSDAFLLSSYSSRDALQETLVAATAVETGRSSKTPSTRKKMDGKNPVDDNDAATYGEYFDAEVFATARAMHIVLQNQELRVADSLFNTSVYTGDLADDAVAPWDNYGSASPIKDVEDAARAVYYRTGLWPNALVLSRIAFRNLRNCEEILDRIAASGAGDRIRATDVTTQQIAEVFDLERVIVGGGSQNLAAKGQDRDIAQIWDSDMAMVCRVAATRDVREPAIGRIFHYSGDGSIVDGRVETYRDEVNRSDIVRVRHQTQEKAIYKELGHLITGLTTEAT